MAEINVLDKHVAELIAAGEVIDRPASVVKELAENAIDAGACAVTVEIQRGGVTFIRVTDDGSGIEAGQIEKALLRHATSKVKMQDDLDAIMTLGFRGEALASISAVSELEIFTRTADALDGVHLVNHGGEQVTLEDAGCAVGTTVVVRNLFYNTPARLKFLKTDAVEGSAVGALLDNLALSHPEISFRLIRDGKEILHTPGDGKLKSAVYAVFGKEFTMGLMPVEYQLEHIQVSGFVSKPSSARPNRRMQHFFINGRYVKCKTAMAAMEQAFKNSIMVGKFPACVMHLKMNCRAVDVNVHPTKLEVRFVNERPVFDAVYHAVKSALLNNDTPKNLNLSGAFDQRPKVEERDLLSGQQVHFREPFQKNEIREQPYRQIRDLPVEPDSRRDSSPVMMDTAPPVHYADPSPSSVQVYPISQEHPVSPDTADKVPEKPGTASDHQTAAAAGEHAALEAPAWTAEPPAGRNDDPPKFIGEAFTTYCIIEKGSRLFLIDKHAAHERLLYEKLKRETGSSCSQILLQPITVTMNKEEYRIVLEHQDMFLEAGFELDDFGEGSVLIRSAPMFLDGADLESILLEMAGYLCSHKTEITSEHLDWVYHNIACRAAIKGGNDTSPRELMALVEQLEQNPDVRYCPHGRPIYIQIEEKDLEKQFGRIQ